MSPPRISVVVPHIPSRRHYLDLCLTSLERAEGIGDEEVVLVVERGDDVREVVTKWSRRVPLCVARSDPGPLSAKRNVAVATARGEVVAFIDDDATVAPDYLGELAAVFDDGAVAVAGAIEPIFEGPVPAELEDALFRIGGFNRYAGEVRHGSRIGANCAFSTAVLRAAGPFDERLGPGGSYLPWGDDEDMFTRMESRGGVTFAPRVLVRHHIQADRLSLAYVLSRAFKSGRTRCVIDWLHHRAFWRGAGLIPIMWVKARLVSLRRGGGLEERIAAKRMDGYLTQLGLFLARGMPGGRRG